MAQTSDGRKHSRCHSIRVTPQYLADVEALAKLQCTPAEIAHLLDYTLAAMTRSLGKGKPKIAFERGRASGGLELREVQFKLAASSSSVALQLGKIYLNQGEQRDSNDNAAAEIAAGAQRVRDMLAAIAAEDDPPEGGGQDQEA